ncbi:MAG TPA: imidazole glycerol phosphate synthase subunit HisH, partial [bacterium]|nr:imidazole glycerol phosphate synthase subunit HisH [bacterium]
MIGIVDYGAGNLLSVAKAFEYLGFSVLIIEKKSDFQRVSKVVIPGVGSFGNAMQSINDSGLIEPVLNWAAKGNPLLGICLGMQMFFDSSEESQGARGLGLIKGECIKFKTGKVPNMGWLEAKYLKEEKRKWFYFVHSYFVVPEDNSVITATAEYETL